MAIISYILIVVYTKYATKNIYYFMQLFVYKLFTLYNKKYIINT